MYSYYTIQMCILCSVQNWEQVEGSVLDHILDGYIDIGNQNNISFTLLQNHLKFVLWVFVGYEVSEITALTSWLDRSRQRINVHIYNSSLLYQLRL